MSEKQGESKAQVTYQQWLEYPGLEVELQEQLKVIKDDAAEIEERFYGNIEFGTGGLRGIIGAGTSRMNIYTVRKATQGLANAVVKEVETLDDKSKASAVIAFDCRNKSDVFAKETARVFAANGIKTYIFREITPTPILSFAIRKLGTMTGVVVTASHNPPEYNGYKAYWSDGAQVATERSDQIMAEMNSIEDVFSIPLVDFDDAVARGLIVWLEADGELMEAYYQKVQGIVLNQKVIAEQADKLKIVFTPLHGTTAVPLPEALRRVGFKNIYTVPEQMVPDPNFSTVDLPNPEDPKAFTLALEVANQKKADIIIGTDPDGDRLGIFVLHDDKYYFLTGNQTGAILLEYVLSQRKALGKLPDNGIVIKTVVTSLLGGVIAESYGVAVEDTLTGFKHIAERMRFFEEDDNKQFQFGYEESYGYLIEGFARDKDGIQASVIAAEAAAYWQAKSGSTLIDALYELDSKYGVYREALKTITIKGLEGKREIAAIMTKMREQPQMLVAGEEVTEIADYQKSLRAFYENGKLIREEVIDMPKSNVLRYSLADGSWFAARPSGTEPKIKFYFGVKAVSEIEAGQKLQALQTAVE